MDIKVVYDHSNVNPIRSSIYPLWPLLLDTTMKKSVCDQPLLQPKRMFKVCKIKRVGHVILIPFLVHILGFILNAFELKDDEIDKCFKSTIDHLPKDKPRLAYGLSTPGRYTMTSMQNTID